MRRRRILITAPALWLAIGAGLAQVPSRPARIGVLGSVPYDTWPRRAIFVEAMRERGWVEGTHYIIDTLVEDGSPESRTALAAELVQRNPALILAPGAPAVGPLMKATRTIPIVFFAAGDPVGAGFVSNLARRRAAGYVDRILKGARPANMPVERPTRFQLALNQHTARAIGVGLPQSLLLRADQVVE